MRQISVVEDPGAAVAERLTAVAEQGGQIVLTGGSTPRAAYELAAERDGDWSGATVWFSDERCVPPDDENSNFGMADGALLSRLSRPPRVMRIEGELGFEAAAGAYDALLREHLGGRPRFDLILLGVGPDGHVASLFPGFPQLDAEAIAVPVVGSPKPPPERITLTFAALNRTREVWFLVAGEGKAEAVARALADDGSVHQTPARGITAEPRTWWLDQPAASSL
jgi:6-phosphogluconolactonase